MTAAKIAFVVASPLAAEAFLVGHMLALHQSHRLILLGKDVSSQTLLRHGVTGKAIPVSINRKVTLFGDIKALFSLIQVLAREKPDVVLSVTPKAGLLAMCASWILNVPVRVHWFTGQVWATRRGAWRLVLKMMDRLIFRLSTSALVDSPSQLDFLVSERVVCRNRSRVLGDGSICGVDTDRFKPSQTIRDLVRQQLGIGGREVVFMFLGRLTTDKGICDLVAAFRRVAESSSAVRLILVGPDEDRLVGQLLDQVGDLRGRMIFLPATPSPERLLAAADVFCMPSYREGFGMTAIEAASVGLPVIASRIYGLLDAVEDGVTGLLHEPRDVPAISHAMSRLTADAEMRKRMGTAGRRRVAERFSAGRITDEFVSFIAGEIRARTKSPPNSREDL